MERIFDNHSDKTISEKTVREELKNSEETNRDNDKKISFKSNVWREYTILKELAAEGGEADIYIVEKDNENYVLKVYRRGMEPKDTVLRRVKELSEKFNKYMIRVLDYGYDENLGKWYELQEYAKFGNLKDYYTSNVLDKSDIYNIIDEINEGLNVLHSNGIVHRDLKPSNILVKHIKPLHLVFTDFGVSTLMEGDISKKLTTVKGTPLYSAPETFTGVMGKEVDYWSLGMIIYEIIAGKNPFQGMSLHTILYTLSTNDVKIPDTAGEYRSLLMGLLTRNPKKRWGYNEVRQWLLGERNIPIYYGKDDKSGLSVPNSPRVGNLPLDNERVNSNSSFNYKFMEVVYDNLEPLALAFVQNYQSFEMAKRHLAKGYLRKWIEKLEDIDKLIWLDDIIDSSKDAEEMVIRFVYNYHKDLPLILYGKVIDEDYIINMIIESSMGKLSGVDETIFDMLKSNRLTKLIEIYENLTDKNARNLIGLIKNYHYANTPEMLTRFVKLCIAYKKSKENNLSLIISPYDAIEFLYTLEERKFERFINTAYDNENIYFLGEKVNFGIIQSYLKDIYDNAYNEYSVPNKIIEFLADNELINALEDVSTKHYFQIQLFKKGLFTVYQFVLSNKVKKVDSLLSKYNQKPKVCIITHSMWNLPKEVEYDRFNCTFHILDNLEELPSEFDICLNLISDFSTDFIKRKEIPETFINVVHVEKIPDYYKTHEYILNADNLFAVNFEDREYVELFASVIVKKKKIRKVAADVSNKLKSDLNTIYEVTRGKLRREYIIERIRNIHEIVLEELENEKANTFVDSQEASQFFVEKLTVAIRKEVPNIINYNLFQNYYNDLYELISVFDNKVDNRSVKILEQVENLIYFTVSDYSYDSNFMEVALPYLSNLFVPANYKNNADLPRRWAIFLGIFDALLFFLVSSEANMFILTVGIVTFFGALILKPKYNDWNKIRLMKFKKNLTKLRKTLEKMEERTIYEFIEKMDGMLDNINKEFQATFDQLSRSVEQTKEDIKI